MYNILVLGSGGREHAIIWSISKDPKVKKIFCAPGNAGTSNISKNVQLNIMNNNEIFEFVKSEEINLIIVGPEQPLVMGIVDQFNEKGLRIFGPSARAAELEGSKSFSKNIMNKYGLPTAEYKNFSSAKEAEEYINDKSCPLVVKADGLAAGKGVLLCRTTEEALIAVNTIMKNRFFGAAGDQIVIEEFLEGQEISVLAFSDGKTVLLMDSAQDHKAAFDGDKGPNTGGMGAYSPAPVFTEVMQQKVRDKIMLPMVRAMKQEGRPYKGVLYAGLMLTKTGPQILEFNARFGDPETQPLLVRMDSDIIPIFEACIDGTLDQCQLNWKDKSSVCVVMAASGYPDSYEKGKFISGLKTANSIPEVVVFHAGTKKQNGKIVTNGGRVLSVTATGENTSSAIERAYEAVNQITWEGIHYRKDIGYRARS